MTPGRDGPPKLWPPYEERQAIERRLKWLRPIWAVISCVLGAFLLYAIWLAFSGS